MKAYRKVLWTIAVCCSVVWLSVACEIKKADAATYYFPPNTGGSTLQGTLPNGLLHGYLFVDIDIGSYVPTSPEPHIVILFAEIYTAVGVAQALYTTTPWERYITYAV